MCKCKFGLYFDRRTRLSESNLQKDKQNKENTLDGVNSRRSERNTKRNTNLIAPKKSREISHRQGRDSKDKAIANKPRVTKVTKLNSRQSKSTTNKTKVRAIQENPGKRIHKIHQEIVGKKPQKAILDPFAVLENPLDLVGIPAKSSTNKCVICWFSDSNMIQCKTCKILVHPDCFGLIEDECPRSWQCDCCASNAKNVR